MSTASTLTSVGSWECVAAEFGEKDTENEGLVAFWVRMPEPRLCKADAGLIGDAPRLKEINAALLEALRLARDAWDTKSEKRNAVAWEAMNAAIAAAEGRP